jgi:hypothetical protein
MHQTHTANATRRSHCPRTIGHMVKRGRPCPRHDGVLTLPGVAAGNGAKYRVPRCLCPWARREATTTIIVAGECQPGRQVVATSFPSGPAWGQVRCVGGCSAPGITALNLCPMAEYLPPAGYMARSGHAPPYFQGPPPPDHGRPGKEPLCRRGSGGGGEESGLSSHFVDGRILSGLPITLTAQWPSPPFAQRLGAEQNNRQR